MKEACIRKSPLSPSPPEHLFLLFLVLCRGFVGLLPTQTTVPSSLACTVKYKLCLLETAQEILPRQGVPGWGAYSISPLRPQFCNEVNVSRKVLLHGKPTPAFPHCHPQLDWSYPTSVSDDLPHQTSLELECCSWTAQQLRIPNTRHTELCKPTQASQELSAS